MNDEISPRALASLIEHTKRAPESALRDDQLSWLKLKQAECNAPRRQHLVFRLDVPGYVIAGRAGEARTLELPDKLATGLECSWRILLAGVGVHYTLNAHILLENAELKQPGNSLRNVIKPAAEWLEKQANCPPLAAALRSPYLVITNEGAIHVDVANRPRIDLG